MITFIRKVLEMEENGHKLWYPCRKRSDLIILIFRGDRKFFQDQKGPVVKDKVNDTLSPRMRA